MAARPRIVRRWPDASGSSLQGGYQAFAVLLAGSQVRFRGHELHAHRLLGYPKLESLHPLGNHEGTLAAPAKGPERRPQLVPELDGGQRAEQTPGVLQRVAV